ncbi:MAG: hypothetical protein ACE5D6_06735 [Candidatus Zixiibacteriota bacterium]
MIKFFIILLGCLIVHSISFTKQLNSIDSINIDDSLSLYKPPYLISIEKVTIDNMKINDTIMIEMQSSGSGLAGFNLKIACTDSFFDIVEILPGEFFDSCNWDFFNTRKIDNDDNLYPHIIWQVTALADIISDSTKDRCYESSKPISLIKLVINNDHISIVPDTSVPIFFFWDNCADNSISGVSGDNLFLSSRVIESYKSDNIVIDNPFPTLKGAPSSCIKAGAINKPVRGIKFINGGIEFKLNINYKATPVEQPIENK